MLQTLEIHHRARRMRQVFTVCVREMPAVKLLKWKGNKQTQNEVLYQSHQSNINLSRFKAKFEPGLIKYWPNGWALAISISGSPGRKVGMSHALLWLKCFPSGPIRGKYTSWCISCLWISHPHLVKHIQRKWDKQTCLREWKQVAYYLP